MHARYFILSEQNVVIYAAAIILVNGPQYREKFDSHIDGRHLFSPTESAPGQYEGNYKWNT